MNKDYEYNGKKFSVLHNDLLHIDGNLYGSKAYMAKEYCKQFPNGIVTCGSRFSTQVLMFAKTCQHYNVPCIVFIPAGQETDIMKELKTTNAQIEYVRPGYTSVVSARAREKAEQIGYRFVPLGMLEEFAFDIVANLVENNVNIIKRHKRLVIPVGSGTTLIGIVHGLKKRKIDIPVLGIMTGMDAKKNIYNKFQQYTENYNITLIKSDLKYSQKLDINIIPDLNETYESKCLPYIQDNDLFWIVNK